MLEYIWQKQCWNKKKKCMSEETERTDEQILTRLSQQAPCPCKEEGKQRTGTPVRRQGQGWAKYRDSTLLRSSPWYWTVRVFRISLFLTIWSLWGPYHFCLVDMCLQVSNITRTVMGDFPLKRLHDHFSKVYKQIKRCFLPDPILYLDLTCVRLSGYC